SCITTSACFPRERKICPQARADPIASPSGRACDVSTKCRRCSICFRTSSSMFYVYSAISTLRTRSFPVSTQKLIDSGDVILRAVQLKYQFRGTAQAQPFTQFTPHKSYGRRQSFHGTRGLLIVALNHPANPR